MRKRETSETFFHESLLFTVRFSKCHITSRSCPLSVEACVVVQASKCETATTGGRNSNDVTNTVFASSAYQMRRNVTQACGGNEDAGVRIDEI